MSGIGEQTSRLEITLDQREIEPSRILTESESMGIVDSAMRAATGGGNTGIRVGSVWQQTIRWARNRIWIARDAQKQLLWIDRNVQNFSRGSAITNRFDPVAIKDTMRLAEQRSLLRPVTNVDDRVEPYPVKPPQLPIPHAPLWSDATANNSADDRTRLVKQVCEAAGKEGYWSAGSIDIRMSSITKSDTHGARYAVFTQAECSTTVRHPKGIGSGWAGISGFDWSRFDPSAIAEKALSKCVASVDPVRIEPGRYTVILEPQATFELVKVLVGSFGRGLAEDGKGPYPIAFDRELGVWITKLGEKIVDERITISHDPMKSGTAMLPIPGIQPITWIENGTLTALSDGNDVGSRIGSLSERNENIPNYFRRSFQMAGGDSSVDAMIASTKRGLLVTRFSDIIKLHDVSLLSTGLTRDGLWLIENGKVSKSVKNMRFADSPLFVLNQIESLGEPVPVFRRFADVGTHAFGSPLGRRVVELGEYLLGPEAAIVPPIKARDFNFVALVDAV